MDDDNEKLFIKDNDGNVKEYSIIYVFNIGTREDDFVLYTDFSTDENATLNIYSGILNTDGTICNVEDENDLKIIDKFLKEFEEDLQ